jgi:hypothetical protein
VDGASDWGAWLRVVAVNGREVRLALQGVDPLPPGAWVVWGAESAFLCDQLMTSTPVEVKPFEFSFDVQGCGSPDYNRDGDVGMDADIDAFFACLAGSCCAACNGVDFNGDGDEGTDADIEAFFRVLAGGSC